MKTAVCLFVSSAIAALGQAPAAWTPELSMQVQSVGSVAPSPDCKLVAWTQTRAVMESEKSENVAQIWLASSDGSNRLQLTRG